ncbi:helix-hairpin-helix domain-containing protein [Arthrobacter sp. NPDC056886]|uniref:helix-hairpin-helix domain-containing protein n=1 Tax=Arthrobacter sp. NPDC056886 TaxID=3345960 RepID=UPI00366B0F45
MSRRNPGAESATGVRVARERLASTLSDAGAEPVAWDAHDARNAADAVDSPSGRGAGDSPQARSPGMSLDPHRAADLSSGLLDVPAPGLPVPSPAASAVGDAGRRSASRSGMHARQPPGRGIEARVPLSAWLRARTGVRAAALLGVLAAVLGGCFWWQAGTGGAQVVAFSESAPAAEEAPDPAAGETIAPPGEDASAGPESIEVHVAGAVLKPGVVQLPSGSRLYEAILAAGGATAKADPDRLNLAAVVEDGQKVLVPIRGEPDPADAPTGSSPASGSAAGGTGPDNDGGKINLNTASLEELGTLPRVGPVLAQRIVDWRQQHGRFRTVQELDAVDGIGPKLLEALLPLVGI